MSRDEGGMAAVSPRDKSRKDGALSPVTSEKASPLSPPRGAPPDAPRSAGGDSLVRGKDLAVEGKVPEI